MPMTLSEVGHMWVRGLVHDGSRYAIFAVAIWFTLWIVLARVLRPRKIRDATPPARQLATEFLFSLRSIAVFSTVGIGISMADRAGVFPMTRAAQQWGPAWAVVSLVVMIIAQDAWIYWIHRWMHQPRWFGLFHRRHHRSYNPSPFTAYSFDLGEALLMVAFVAVWPAIFPTTWGVINVFMIHQILRNTLLHSGYELTPARADGRPWFDWLTTATHHDLHHAQAAYNLAPWFTWWDRWMRTEHPDYIALYAANARSSRSTPGPQTGAART